MKKELISSPLQLLVCIFNQRLLLDLDVKSPQFERRRQPLVLWGPLFWVENHARDHFHALELILIRDAF